MKEKEFGTRYEREYQSAWLWGSFGFFTRLVLCPIYMLMIGYYCLKGVEVDLKTYDRVEKK